MWFFIEVSTLSSKRDLFPFYFSKNIHKKEQGKKLIHTKLLYFFTHRNYVVNADKRVFKVKNL